jgi:hypothetical protein
LAPKDFQDFYELCLLSNSNGFAFFVWQKMEFANSQINMGRRKKGYLQRFGKIDLPKSKKETRRRGREERMWE